MKKMKRIGLCLLAASMSVALFAGCDSSAAPTAAGTGGASGEKTINFVTAENAPAPSFDGLKGEKEGKKIKIGFTISANDQYGALMSTAMIEKAKALGAEVTLVESKENDNTMIGQIQQFTTDGTDVIICQLSNTKIAQQAINAANGIPIIFLNRIAEGDFTGNAYYVGSDDYEAGLFQGQALLKFFEGQGKKDINLVQFTGNVGASNATFRTNGVKDALEKGGMKVNYAYNDSAKWQRTDANNMMQTFLGTNKPYDAVAANNDEMAMGAIIAMKTAGVDFAKVPVVGVDATKDGLLAVKAGELYATVFQDAKGQGEGALAVALSLANGKTAPVKVGIPFILVTKDNLADFMK